MVARSPIACVQPLQVRERDFGLPLEDGFDVIRPGHGADVPLLDVADAFRVLQKGGGDQCDIAEGQAAKRAEQGLIGGLMEPLGQRLVMLELRSRARVETLRCCRLGSECFHQHGSCAEMASKKCPPAGIRPLGGTERSLPGHCSRSPLGSY